MTVFEFLSVLIGMFFTDVLFAIYVRRTSQGMAFQAAFFGALIAAVAAFVVVSYVANHWLIIPAVIGSFLGTYLIVKFDKKKDKE